LRINLPGGGGICLCRRSLMIRNWMGVLRGPSIGGAVTVPGGRGYLELTGYAQDLHL
jgi:hypothetical protein